MYCGNCGNKLPEDAKFCPKCGQKVEKREADAMPIAIGSTVAARIAPSPSEPSAVQPPAVQSSEVQPPEVEPPAPAVQSPEVQPPTYEVRKAQPTAAQAQVAKTASQASAQAPVGHVPAAARHGIWQVVVGKPLVTVATVVAVASVGGAVYVSTQPAAPQAVSQEAGSSAAAALADPAGAADEAQTYTIVFNPNGGDGTMPAQTAASDGANLAANAFRMQDYVFTGWNTQADGSGTSYSDGQAVSALADASGTVTLYAQWEKDPAVVAAEKAAAEKAAAEQAKQKREANAQAFAEQVLTNWPDTSKDIAPRDYDAEALAMKYVAPGSKLATEGINYFYLGFTHADSSEVLSDDGTVVTVKVNVTEAGGDHRGTDSHSFRILTDENGLVTDYQYVAE